MKTSLSLSLIPALLICAATAEEFPVTPKIDSVGLFKNGLCVVHASFEAKSPGTFVWSDPPRCVHGTFLVDASGPITLSSGMRIIEESVELTKPTGVLQTDLGGQDVKIRLRASPAGGEAEIVGRVWNLPEVPPERKWNNALAGESYELRDGNAIHISPPSNYLVVESEKKRIYVDISQIASIEVAGSAPARKRSVEKPVMFFNTDKAGVIRVSYLTRGAAWVPSYRVDLSDAKSLKVSQSALIRNELTPWKGVTVQVISGFPNVRFGHVDSPLWPNATLAGFFSQIAREPRSGGAATQQVAYNSARFAEAAVPEFPVDGSQGEDLHFEGIGTRDLAPGETLSLEVASGTADYERVVEWTAPDTRGEYGQYVRNDSRRDDDEQTWDAVLFQNPLKFPMTTAAATITERGEFRGQSMSQWTNPGQRACLKITRALSVQADRQEVEDDGKREQIVIGGSNYYRATVKGTITMRNYRPQPAVMLAKAQFSGELLKADDNPGNTLRKEGVFSINPRHELEWKLTLAAGAEKSLTYRYTVLVRN